MAAAAAFHTDCAMYAAPPCACHEVLQSSSVCQEATSTTPREFWFGSSDGSFVAPLPQLSSLPSQATSSWPPQQHLYASDERSRPTTSSARKSKAKKKKKSSYKHVPHSEKPAHLVARRNARERRRVQEVNKAFVVLRRRVPVEIRGKRVSKAKTLRLAIDYIGTLQRMLGGHESNSGALKAQFYERAEALESAWRDDAGGGVLLDSVQF